ncbi:MAG: hypothetical protein F4Y75_06185 [Acidimicrobiia bacterium]|nr:hypothetical protein [Acidimicrobiia bacterium]
MAERNLLEELMELLQEPGRINWALADQLADHLSGPSEAIDPWLADEYLEIARTARMRFTDATDLRVDHTLQPVLVDRKDWARLHLRSFGYMVEPLADLKGGGEGPLDSLLQPLGAIMAGLHAGLLAGSLSCAFGTFDTGLPTARPLGFTFHIPAIERFASEYDLDPLQVRMWVALHEVAHEALLGLPWVRPYLIDLLGDLTPDLEFDLNLLPEWQDALTDPQLPVGNFDFGPTLFSGEIDEDRHEKLQAAMSMLEGYVTYLVGEASEGYLPDREEITSAWIEHLSARYEELESAGAFPKTTAATGGGTDFYYEVRERWGSEAVGKVWLSSENLPTVQEIEDVTGWAARVLLDDPFTE